MIVSARERLIVQLLMEDADQEVTIKELAEQIDVSERTIHRDLKNIESVLHKFNLQLVKRAGIGIKMVGSETSLTELRIAIQKQDYKEYTPDERMIVALCTLLDHHDPIKLQSLANELGVTTATISHDLDKMEPFVEEYGLTLIRRRGYGIELTGSEEAKRKAIKSLISDRFDVPDFLRMVRENIERKSTNKIDSISERLLGLVQKEKLIIIEDLINKINSRLPYPLADSSYVGLVVHLALAIERIQRGENITIKGDYLKQLKVSREFTFAEDIAEKLEETFQIKIPEDEKGYITMHLRGAKLRFEGKVDIQDENVEIAYLVQRLIEQVELLTNKELKHDTSLFHGLLAHLQPAVYRLKQGMKITNPLLKEIKRDHHVLFGVVQQAVKAALPFDAVPEEEIGYLVLHFGAALNKRKSIRKLKALIICSSGIGTSKMLATQINNQFPHIAELRNISAFELKETDVTKYDLILSTIPIEDISTDYLLVSPILTTQELEKIKDYIEEKGLEIEQSTSFEESDERVDITISFEQYERFTSQSQRLIRLLKELEVFQLNNTNHVESILLPVSKQLKQIGLVESEQRIVEALLEREHIGGLAIPETKLALFHARNEAVVRPSFHMIDLQTPMKLRAMDNELNEVSRILLLIAPEDAEAEELEIMSFISASIIESQESIHMFEKATKSGLTHYISQKYFTNYLQQLRSV
ncbi:BglG family transcription antiterminator [Metabacillus halosaccharovorans]|uniref:BglG family transcription antiterminator n=1 Tax=Metabacillus halosaccharovorans TaxID=930124 RepID=UPI00203BF93B|nr:BglG family transcription antiterminator [Metabacillus halosaccharovorans]MCM3443018.1 BglG family transcription antiterminator [Metabacillus halosaccharovorans]